MAVTNSEIIRGYKGEIERRELEDLTSFLRKKNIFVDRSRVAFNVKRPGDWILVDVKYGILTQTDSQSSTLRKNIDTCKVLKFRRFSLLILKPVQDFQSESLIGLLRGTLSVSTFAMKSLISLTNDLKSIGWIINVLTILFDLRDPYVISFSRLFSLLMRIIACVIQVFGSYKDYRSETLSVSDLLLMMSIAGLPSRLVSKVDVFSRLTGKRFSDSGFLMTVVSEFLDIVLGALEWAASKDPTEYGKMFVNSLREQLAFVTTYRYVKEMTEYVTTYHKDQQVILDVQYRLKAGECYEKMKSHAPTYAFCRDSANRATYQLWVDFTSINVLIRNYSISSRMEPVCVVFEGKAGVRKSTFMNKIVAALKHDNFSTYSHTVPDINAGKDFYDDYMNQDVFYMDDVGQQGKSQWRSIINFVAPVKYPLECAAADKKNTKFFSSKLILCTTNSFMNLQGFTAKDCISEPEALFRRCHVLKFASANKITYHKYDYINSHKWTNTKLPPFDGCKFPTSFEKSEKENLRDVYSMIKELIEGQALLQSNNEMSDDELDFIVDKGDTFQDAVTSGMTSESLFGKVKGYLDIAQSGVMELFGYLRARTEHMTTLNMKDPKVVLGLTAGTVCLTFIFYHIQRMGGNIDVDDDDAGVGDIIQTWKDVSPVKHTMFSEAGENMAGEDETNNTRRYFRFFEIFYYYEGVMKTEYCQGCVSGKYALLPAHALGDNMSLNIFRNWDSYQAKHYEFNLVPCTIVKHYPHLDVAIVELCNLPVVPYKNANMIFKRECVKTFSNELYFCNAYHRIRNIYGTNIKMITEAFRVVNYRRELAFGPDSGLTYGISALGLCGSLIIDKFNGFIGMHVAGNGTDGFAVVPSFEIRQEIANIMLSSADPNFDHRENLFENFSGSRLQYEKAQLSMAMGKSNLKPTALNKEFNEEVAAVCEQLEVAEKLPTQVCKYGSPVKTLKKCSKKSFVPIHPISLEEKEYAKKCLDSMFIDFDDLTDEQTAFGDGDMIGPLNKDSANGYGYKPSKSAYFDFENKTISPEFLQEVDSFLRRVDNGTTTWEDFVAKESLKDEMRPAGKDPRVFRVMPLHHIYLVKKYIGKLFAHIRKDMWNNGIALGMNPYQDWKKLYNRLRACFAVFAVDFGKWDGSCHAMIQDIVTEVVLGRYRGQFRLAFTALLHSMVRGFTLVADELYMTTHSLPSGAWITALFNSFINKVITAITIFREMKKVGKTATVEDFRKVVDFVLGDDKVCGVPKEYAGIFNAFTLKDTAASLGMDVTDCNKQPITTPFHKLEELSFLKRTFRVHPVMGVVGPLSLDTMVTTLQWYDSTKEYDVVMEGKSIVLQIEAYLHSREMLHLFQKLMREYPWYREFSEMRILNIMDDSDTVFAYVKEVLDKKY